MPLGGLGTGSLAIRGDGSLGQWQIVNRINHIGYVPLSFFALFWDQDAKRGARLLQSDEFWDLSEFTPPVSTTDHVVPGALRRWAEPLPKARIASFDGKYPVATVDYDLGEDCPFRLRMKAWSPLVPGNAADSGWPVAVFEFEFENLTDHSAHAHLLSSLQNCVGWDGVTEIDGIRFPGYGGNFNTFESFDGNAYLWMENVSLPEDHPSQGVVAMACEGAPLEAAAQWARLEEIWGPFRDKGRILGYRHIGPSRNGETWNGAFLQARDFTGGEKFTFTVVLAWHFPNRYLDYELPKAIVPDDKSRFFLGNRYAERGSPRRWLPEFMKRRAALAEATDRYVEELYGRDLPPVVLDAIGSNVANLRTNVCLWTADGRFHGFEGGHGASTWEGPTGVGGSCPMNCTHVWNYDQTLLHLWPDLFRSMRETDWDVNLHPTGYLPHRTILPLFLPRMWDMPIEGPVNPAIDGLFAAMLKTYQYALHTGDWEWVRSRWPKVKTALAYVFSLDPDEEGVIRGEQPNTYDISLFGPNTFIGSQLLAALRAVEEMALKLGDDEVAQGCRRRFEIGTVAYDAECFNGEYFVQRVPEGCQSRHQFGLGCVTDQLLGEWWAQRLGLGSVLPVDHIRQALRAIFRRNFRTSFEGFVQTPREFASASDAGLLNATYEPGERPEVPLLYSDEVWPGVEYAYASLCLSHGLVEPAMTVVQAVRSRYDGRERNPFNEVECGDHYIRSLSAWAFCDSSPSP